MRVEEEARRYAADADEDYVAVVEIAIWERNVYAELAWKTIRSSWPSGAAAHCWLEYSRRMRSLSKSG